MRKKALVLAVLMTATVVVCASLFAGGGSQGGASGAAAPSGGSVKMTDVGTPRAETLIVDNMDGIVADPTHFNPHLPGWAGNGGSLYGDAPGINPQSRGTMGRKHGFA